MAAILCQGIGKTISACCDCIGSICKLPCKICDKCCEGLGRCCNESCNLVTHCCQSRFCCYITLACILNIPPILIGLTDVPNALGGCSGSLWLFLFWILCLIHIAAAFYMSHAIEKDDSILPSSYGDGGVGQRRFQRRAQDGMGRMSHLFCYDGWMAIYILVVTAFVGWLMLGGVWFASGTMDEDDSCHENITGRLGIAYAFGWAFVFIGSCGLCFSVCFGVFCGRTKQQQQSQTATATAPTSGNDGNLNYGATDPPKAEAIPVVQATAVPY